MEAYLEHISFGALFICGLRQMLLSHLIPMGKLEVCFRPNQWDSDMSFVSASG